MFHRNQGNSSFSKGGVVIASLYSLEYSSGGGGEMDPTVSKNEPEKSDRWLPRQRYSETRKIKIEEAVTFRSQ